jgi:hypothetical protein
VTEKHAGPLDRPSARVGAVLVGLAAAALLIYIERDRFLAAETPAKDPADAAFLACFEQETVVIEKMQMDGVVDESRASLFRSRAEARCRAQNPSP